MSEKQINRVFNEPNHSYFLFGPYGAGKSTMVYQRNPDALVIDLKKTDVRFTYLMNPDYLLDVVRAQPNGKTIIIDEIQNVPSLLSLVHILIEQKREWKFILIGIDSFRICRAKGDLLAGRAWDTSLHPFMACELLEKFSLARALKYGLLPLIVNSNEPEKALQDYLTLHVIQEVKSEGLIKRIELFARFLSAMTLAHSNELNVTDISQSCYVKRTTVKSWVNILLELRIGFLLYNFSYKAKRELTSHRRFFLFDTGIFNALQPKLHQDQNKIESAALKGLVAQHLAAWISYAEDTYRLYFWQTRAGSSVDFIVSGESGFWAIEVKNSTNIKPKDLNSLKNFKEDYPQAKTILLYRGKDRLLKKHILCIPVEEFLLQVEPNKPLDHAFNITGF